MRNPAGLTISPERRNNHQPSPAGFLLHKTMNMKKYNKLSVAEKLLKARDIQCAELKEENERLKTHLSESEEDITMLRATGDFYCHEYMAIKDDYAKLKANYQELLEFMNRTVKKYTFEMDELANRMNRL